MDFSHTMGTIEFNRFTTVWQSGISERRFLIKLSKKMTSSLKLVITSSFQYKNKLVRN